MLKVANVIKVITMISKTTVKDLGQQSGQNTSYNNNNSSNNKPDNPFANETDRLILVMMTYHSNNKMNV